MDAVDLKWGKAMWGQNKYQFFLKNVQYYFIILAFAGMVGCVDSGSEVGSASPNIKSVLQPTSDEVSSVSSSVGEANNYREQQVSSEYAVISDVDSLSPILSPSLVLVEEVFSGSDVKLAVTENPELSGFGHVKVTLQEVTNPPVEANAGEDQEVASGAAVVLDGSASSGGGTNVEYLWQQTAGRVVDLLVGDPTDKASFTAPTVSNDELLTFRLRVSGDFDDADTDIVTVKVLAKIIIPDVGLSGRLNDTGIVKCMGLSGNRSNCPDGSLKQQDGDIGRDVLFPASVDGHAGFSYTKLDQNGQALPVSAANWFCVKDNVTGLLWESKSVDGGLRDKNWTYSWYNPDNNLNGRVPGEIDSGVCSGSKCDTYNYVRAVNATTLCGYNKWRMPSRAELRGLVNYNRTPTIDPAFFPDVISSKPYWTGSPYAQSTGWEPGIYKWSIYFKDGGDYFAGPIYAYPVRLVYGE